jgi:histidinol-phosphate phosphatase family protein
VIEKLQVVFLDRDGVINRESAAYIKNLGEFEFLPGSLKALVDLSKAGLKLILITNQSAIGRGLTSQAHVEQIHHHIIETVAAGGGRIKDIFYCPHTPEDNCACRKPKPGMILEAARRHGLDLDAAVMVGDSARDIRCAKAAGCRGSILVQSGNYEAASRLLVESAMAADHVALDLAAAAAWILGRVR